MTTATRCLRTVPRYRGNRLPVRVEAGNMFGTRDCFPFFLADVTAIGFPGAQP